MSQPETTPPINPLPPVVVALCLIIAGVEIAFSLGERGILGGPDAIAWRHAFAQQFGFSVLRFDWMMQNNHWPLEHLQRFVTYSFMHWSFTHAIFAIVILLAIGKMVGEALGNLAVAVVFLVAGVVGALVYGLILSENAWLIGAYPSVYGLIGTYTYLLWLRLGFMGDKQIRAFTMIGVLMGLQLFWGVFFGGGAMQWIADLSGFVAGFLSGMLLVPGAMRALLQRLRRD